MSAESEIASAIKYVFVSPNVCDSNGEPANLVDMVQAVSMRLGAVARAITAEASPGPDAIGGTVMSLTEAVMGMTAGLVAVASSISELASAAENQR